MSSLNEFVQKRVTCIYILYIYFVVRIMDLPNYQICMVILYNKMYHITYETTLKIVLHSKAQ